MTRDDEMKKLYGDLLAAWNRRDASGMARLYANDGLQVGFDGSHMSGAAEIEAHLAPIFASHPTGKFVGIVRSVHELGADVALLHAHAGMVPPGKDDIKPELNAVQTLVAKRLDSAWRVALFQNTPAAYHGRPEAADKLTAELGQASRAKD